MRLSRLGIFGALYSGGETLATKPRLFPPGWREYRESNLI
jgi:hypothetical protein